MAVGAVLGTVGAVGGLVGGVASANAADKASRRQADSAAFQNQIARDQQDLSQEQWDLYKNEVYPMEIEAQQLGLDYQKIAFEQYEDYYAPLAEEFAKEASEGIEAQPERAARDARIDIDQAFDSEEGMMQRNLERRGVRAGSGNYNSGIADTSLNRAAAKGFSVNRAVEHERDRVEDTNFNRKAVALGRTPSIPGGSSQVGPGVASATLGGAGRTAYGAGSQEGAAAGRYGNAAAGAFSGAIQLGTQAYDTYNKYSQPSSVPTYSNTSAAPVTANTSVSGISNVDIGFNNGGVVNAPDLNRSSNNNYNNGGMVSAYNDGGLVNGPEGVDQVPAYIESPDGTRTPARLTHKEYVIPDDVVASIGTDALDDIIENTRKRKQESNNQGSPNALARRMH